MTRAKATFATALLCAAASLGACNSTPAPPVTVTASRESPAPAPAAGILDGPIGQSLDEKSRATAIATQQDAVSSGTRKSWRGDRGAYGFVTPGAVNGECREYTHKVFINGRPREARGEACLDQGDWRIKS